MEGGGGMGTFFAVLFGFILTCIHELILQTQQLNKSSENKKINHTKEEQPQEDATLSL